MGREIRRVPANWEHPKTHNGSYKPLRDDYVGSLEYFKEEVDDFIKYMTEVVQTGKVKIYSTVFRTPEEAYEYLTEDGQMNPPEIKDYMPTGDWYQLFENVSEGTPITPPFETKQELVNWLSNNKDFWDHTWSKEAAQDIVESGYAMSGIMAGGKYYTPEEQHLLKNTSTNK
jgi:hypothetical protein